MVAQPQTQKCELSGTTIGFLNWDQFASQSAAQNRPLAELISVLQAGKNFRPELLLDTAFQQDSRVSPVVNLLIKIDYRTCIN